MRRSHHPESRSIGARPWATRLAALLAVFLQAFVLQTHVHAFVPLAAAGYERTADSASAAVENTAQQELQAACALCQAQSARRALAPSAQPIVIDGGGAFIEPASEVRRVTVAASHSWQSRAPPAHL
jgi:hypothetical protein